MTVDVPSGSESTPTTASFAPPPGIDLSALGFAGGRAAAGGGGDPSDADGGGGAAGGKRPNPFDTVAALQASRLSGSRGVEVFAYEPSQWASYGIKFDSPLAAADADRYWREAVVERLSPKPSAEEMERMQLLTTLFPQAARLSRGDAVHDYVWRMASTWALKAGMPKRCDALLAGARAHAWPAWVRQLYALNKSGVVGGAAAVGIATRDEVADHMIDKGIAADTRQKAGKGLPAADRKKAAAAKKERLAKLGPADAKRLTELAHKAGLKVSA